MIFFRIRITLIYGICYMQHMLYIFCWWRTLKKPYIMTRKKWKSLDSCLTMDNWSYCLLLQQSAIYYIYITIYYIYITIYNSTSYNIIQEHGPTVTTRLRDELAKFTSMSHSLVLQECIIHCFGIKKQVKILISIPIRGC